MAERVVTYTTPIAPGSYTQANVTVTEKGAITAIASGGSPFAPSGFTSTVTAGGTTTLTNTSTEQQYFTGVTFETVALPVVATLANGWFFKIVNLSTDLVTVASSGATNLTTLPGSGGWGLFTCINTGGGAGATGWSFESGLAIGKQSTSVQAGSSANAGGPVGGTAVGGFAAATTHAVAVGNQSTATQQDCVALGAQATCSVSTGAVAVGQGSSAGGTDSTSVGRSAVTTLAESIALGANATVADTAHALGYAVNAASVNPGSFGLTVNAGLYQLPLYSSLYASTATAAGTTTLTVASAHTQRFSGATTQTCVLPVVTTLANGFEFVIFNDSTGAVTVQSSGGNTIATLAAAVGGVNRGGWGRFICVDTAGGTGVASWSYLSGATIL